VMRPVVTRGAATQAEQPACDEVLAP